MHHAAINAIRAVPAAFCALLLACLLAGNSLAQEARTLKGVALIIGQSRYAHVTPLANPAQDARAVDQLLTSLGFDTRSVTDRDTDKLKRDIERFAEDAEGADVALLYYSGHGIEAGGENYLIPIDANLDSLGEAGERLVPLSRIMDRLKQNVPVTILLLDACRTNPFPPGATIKIAGQSAPQAVAATGLGAPRGMSALDDQPASDSLGIVVGLAAEPGQVALDGEPGGNSPYAAALVRHLSAVKSEEFGTVMRMVTEEVYLSTKTRQRPWINESLRRLLYFGAEGREETGDEALITGERRGLLLTIAALPTTSRQQVETIAQSNGVPLDALYAMLRVLGQEAPNDPAEFDRLLREQSERLKTLIAERDALSRGDPEIARLSALAERAIAQGALQGAIHFREAAKKKAGESSAPLEQIEANLKARRLELAAVYASSAETYALAFDYRRAAEDYGQASEQAARWDSAAAIRYKLGQADSLQELALFRTEYDAFEQAARSYEEALALAAAAQIPLAADIRHRLATAYEGALTERGERLYLALAELGPGHKEMRRRELSVESLQQAVSFHQETLATLDEARTPQSWADALSNLGSAYYALAERDDQTINVAKAIASYEQALATVTRSDNPGFWATTQSNLGLALLTLARRQNDHSPARAAVAAYEAALGVRGRETAPLAWAATQNRLGSALLLIGIWDNDAPALEKAIDAFDAALGERTRERVPLAWATTQNGRGEALYFLGQRRNDLRLIEQSIAAFEASVGERTRERTPYAWASTQKYLGDALQIIGGSETGTRSLDKAVAAYDAALSIQTEEQYPFERTFTQSKNGEALFLLGLRLRDRATLGLAKAAVLDAWKINYRMWGVAYDDYADLIHRIDTALAQAE